MKIKNVLLYGLITIICLSSTVLASDAAKTLPILGDMSFNDGKYKEAIDYYYGAYVNDVLDKKEAIKRIDKVQNETNKEYNTLYGKTEYNYNKVFPNIILTKNKKTINKKFRIYTVVIQNHTDTAMVLNAQMTKITAITQDGKQIDAYTIYDSEVPEKLIDNMISDNKIYSGASDGFYILFPYEDIRFKTFYIDALYYNDHSKEIIKIDNLY